MRRRGRERARAARRLEGRLRRRARRWTPTSSRRPGCAEADAAVVSTDGDNSNLVIGQILQRRYGIGCVVVRVLDPARAEFYAKLGLRTVCPTQTAISSLTEAVRACEHAASCQRGDDLMYVVVAGGGKVGSNIARSLIEMQHEVTLVEQRRDRFDAARGRVRPRGDARRRDRDRRARAGGDRAAARSRARGHRRRRGQPHHLPDRQGGLRRPEGDRAGQRPAQPADTSTCSGSPRRSARPRACSASSSTRCPSTASCGCSSSGGKGSRSSRCRSRRTRRQPASGSRAWRCPRAPASSR